MNERLTRAEQIATALQLQSRLLALDDLVQSFDHCAVEDLKRVVRTPGHEDDEEPPVDVTSLKALINAVYDLFNRLVAHAPGHLDTLPRWLMPPRTGESAVVSFGGLRLLDDRLRTLDGPWMPVALALSDSPEEWMLGQIDETWRALTSGRPAPEPLPTTGEDLVVRVPIVDQRSRNGLVVRLTLERMHAEAAETPRVHGSDGHAAGSFREGVERGLSAALFLADRIGVPAAQLAAWTRLRIREIDGGSPGHPVQDGSAGGPVAVEILRRLLGLPDPGALVSGAIAPSGHLCALDPDQFKAKAVALAEHGFTLMRLNQAVDLGEVCANIWGHAWEDALRVSAEAWLTDRGFEVREVTSARQSVSVPGGHSLRVVRLPLADRIEQRLHDGARVVVVGGPRASSRTISSEQAATAYGAQTSTRVLRLDLAHGRVPVRSVLHAAIRYAYAARGVRAGDEVVIVLEDLLPHEAESDLDAVLPAVAADLDARIIAICLYTGGTRWSTDEVATVPAIRRHDEVVEFTRKLLATNGIPDPDRPTMIGLEQRAAGGDLGLLAGLLATRLSRPTEASAIADVRLAWSRELTRDASPEDLVVLRAVAACSLMQVGMPQSMLTDTTRLRVLGGTCDERRRWRLPPSVSRGLLAAVGGTDAYADPAWVRNADAQYAALNTFLAPRVASYDRRVAGLVAALLSGAETIEPRLHRRLLLFLSTYLTDLLRTNARPGILARVLLTSGFDMPTDARGKLLEALLANLRDLTWSKLTITEASYSLSALRAHRDEIEHSAALKRIYDDWVMPEVRRQLAAVVATADPYSSALLIHELGQFHEESTNRDIGALVLVAARRLDETSPAGYEAAVSLLEAAARYDISPKHEFLRRFAGNPGPARLLAHDTGEHAGLLLGQVAVRRWVEPTPSTEVSRAAMRRDAIRVRRLLALTSLVRLHDGLALLARVDQWYARGVVRNLEPLVPWLKEKVRWAAPWESATTLRLLGGLHVETAIAVLYRPDETYDDTVINAMASEVVALGDVKGAGHILSAVASVDRNWGPGGPAAASYALCQALAEFIDRALATELRGSVVLATMSSLVDAGCPTDVLRRLLDRCADLVSAEIDDNEKEHGPRLALLLAGHEELGLEFVALLEARVSKALIVSRVSRLTDSASVKACTAYHRLARVLGLTKQEESAERLIDQDRIRGHLAGLAHQPVMTALESVAEYRETLSDTGHPMAGSQLLAGVDDSVTAWARRLRALYNPGKLAAALDLMRGISSGFAEACLTELENRSRPGHLSDPRERIWSERIDPTSQVDDIVVLPSAARPTPMRLAVQARRRQAALPAPRGDDRVVDGLVGFAARGFIRPAQAIVFVDAVDRIDPGAGAKIGRALSVKTSWPQRRRLIADVDNPVHLGELLRKMSILDLEVTEDFVHHLARIWCPFAPHIRSLTAAGALLTGFAACGPAGVRTAAQWADGLRVDRIAQRLVRSGGDALDRLPWFVRALDTWGPPGAAAPILHVVSAESYNSTVPRRIDDLLRCVADAKGVVSASHLAVAGRALASSLPCSRLVNRRGFWRSVGLLCRTLHRLGGDAYVPREAIAATLATENLDPVLSLWVGTSAFGAQWGPVSGVSVSDALAVASGDRSAITRACLALSTVALGRVDDGLLGEIDVADVLDHLSPRWQLELLETATSHRTFALHLEDEREWLAETGDWLVKVGSPAGAALRRAVSAWPTVSS